MLLFLRIRMRFSVIFPNYSHIPKSLLWSSLVPSTFWSVVHSYPGCSVTRHSVCMSYPISSVVLYLVQNWSCISSLGNLSIFFTIRPNVSCSFSRTFHPVAVTLLASIALMVQFLLPYNEAGRSSVLYNCTFFCYK